MGARIYLENISKIKRFFSKKNYKFFQLLQKTAPTIVYNLNHKYASEGRL